MQDGLILRDLHRPPAPPFWPPAPGWWMLATAIALAALVALVVRRRRARARARWSAAFDASLAHAAMPTARLAVASELLRRAARTVRVDADRLDGEPWLAFLDTPATRFLEGPGRLLLDGPFRADVDAAQAGVAVELARRRFVSLMTGRR
ncbi:DUF4381 family protein [Lysobacter xanthus]